MRVLSARSGLVGLALAAAVAWAGPLGATSAAAAGGTLIYGMPAETDILDPHATGGWATYQVTYQIFESFVKEDLSDAKAVTPKLIPGLATSWDVSHDGKEYTFHLRQGVKFHNSKTLSSADVLASYERYKAVGLQRNTFDNIANWEVPDASTFVIHLKQPQPTFLEQLSSFSVPIVIIPAEDKDDPPQQLKTIGTGPWELVQSVPGGFVKLKRFDGYQPNAHYDDKTGFGGYKQACFDTVTFRIVTEPQARVAGIQTGELGGVEDVPATSVPALKKNAGAASWVNSTGPA